MSSDYANEKLSACVSTLATSPKGLPDRLAEVAEQWVRLEPSDFPAAHRTEYAAIDEALSAAGEIRETIRGMSPDRAAEMASRIFELYEASRVKV